MYDLRSYAVQDSRQALRDQRERRAAIYHFVDESANITIGIACIALLSALQFICGLFEATRSSAQWSPMNHLAIYGPVAARQALALGIGISAIAATIKAVASYLKRHVVD